MTKLYRVSIFFLQINLMPLHNFLSIFPLVAKVLNKFEKVYKKLDIYNKIQLKSKDILDEFSKESGLEVDEIQGFHQPQRAVELIFRDIPSPSVQAEVQRGGFADLQQHDALRGVDRAGPYCEAVARSGLHGIEQRFDAAVQAGSVQLLGISVLAEP